MLVLEDGQIAYGDCAAVQYSGAGGRDPLFLAEDFIPVIENEIAPMLVGQEADSFRRLAEIIDPDTGEVLPEGETGELVITPLSKEAFPIFRYRTKDIAKITYEPCECGRTFARMNKVVGRTDDMLIIKGVNVFPSQIESVLIQSPHIGPHYQLILRKKNYMDNLEVKVELIDGSLLDQYGALEKVAREIRAQLRTVLGLDCKVTLVEPRSIERSTGKAKRIVDLRNKPNS